MSLNTSIPRLILKIKGCILAIDFRMSEYSLHIGGAYYEDSFS
jgi:hypothetical protein